ncbi:hypothetical protein [Cupriavidus necator]
MKAARNGLNALQRFPFTSVVSLGIEADDVFERWWSTLKFGPGRRRMAVADRPSAVIRSPRRSNIQRSVPSRKQPFNSWKLILLRVVNTVSNSRQIPVSLMAENWEYPHVRLRDRRHTVGFGLPKVKSKMLPGKGCSQDLVRAANAPACVTQRRRSKPDAGVAKSEALE